MLAKDFRVTALFREDEGRVGADIHELVFFLLRGSDDPEPDNWKRSISMP